MIWFQTGEVFVYTISGAPLSESCSDTLHKGMFTAIKTYVTGDQTHTHAHLLAIYST
jgi:hypothetical protein